MAKSEKFPNLSVSRTVSSSTTKVLPLTADTQTDSVSTLVEGANINRIQWLPDGNGCYYEAVWKPKQLAQSNQLFSMDLNTRRSVPVSEKSISLDDPDPTPKITEHDF